MGRGLPDPVAKTVWQDTAPEKDVPTNKRSPGKQHNTQNNHAAQEQEYSIFSKGTSGNLKT